MHQIMYNLEQIIEITLEYSFSDVYAEIHSMSLIETNEWGKNGMDMFENSCCIRKKMCENSYSFMHQQNCKDNFEHEVFLHKVVLYQ